MSKKRLRFALFFLATMSFGHAAFTAALPAQVHRQSLFKLDNLSAWTYEVEARHEKAGTHKTTVIIKDGETKSADFVFSI